MNLRQRLENHPDYQALWKKNSYWGLVADHAADYFLDGVTTWKAIHEKTKTWRIVETIYKLVLEQAREERGRGGGMPIEG